MKILINKKELYINRIKGCRFEKGDVLQYSYLHISCYFALNPLL